MEFVVNGLIVLGAGFLLAALLTLWRLIKQLPLGEIRRDWYLVAGAVLFVMVYFVHALANGNRFGDLTDVLISLLLFVAASMLWIIITLSLNTAIDVRRFTMLERDRINDPLMGIYNRRYLDRRLEEEIARANRYDLPLSVLLIVIDQFTAINKAHGRQVGDLVLKRLGALLVEAVRTSDVVARYSDEEVLIIAPNTSAPSAAILAERLRKKVETSVLLPPNVRNQRSAISATVSIGVSTFGQTNEGTRALVDDAGDALRQATVVGLNQVSLGDSAKPPN